jgi:transcriptional regulator with XRE-family HTH domain
MNGELTTRDQIVTYAEQAKRAGQSYRETAEKLGVSTRTLRRYRKGRTEPAKRVETRMKRGGKLTQLRQQLPGNQRGEPPGPPEATQTLRLDDAIERPNLPMTILAQMGEGTFFPEDTIAEAIEIEVTAREHVNQETGDSFWTLGGPADDASLIEIEQAVEFRLAIGSIQNERHLAGRLRDELAARDIIYPDRRR